MENVIRLITVFALPMIFAITMHEAAHGYVARKLGDSTAYMLGRVTLNPFKHIDPVGTIAIPLILAVLTSGAFVFGFAKPVPVNFGNLRNPKRDMIWVALAGPGSNFVQAIFWALIIVVLHLAQVQELFFMEVAKAGVLVNVVMFAFNLFPLPPLDGGRIVTGLLPTKYAIPFARIEPYGFFIVMALVFTRVVDIWMTPVMGFAFGVVNLVVSLFT